MGYIFKSIAATQFLSNMLFMYFLCQLTYQSADLSGFSSETTRPRDMLFFLKLAYVSRMKNCSRHTDLFVRLFATAITSELLPHPKCENFNTLSHFSH